MPLVRSGSPAAEPVTLAEAKLHCRVDHSTDDALINVLISAAREQAETRCSRTLIDQAWVLTLDAFPDAIRLRMPRVGSVASVQYLDVDGDLQTLSSGSYQLDRAGEIANWLVPAYGYAWPQTRRQPNAVTVTYVAGYGSAASAVPASIRAWILLTIGVLYANREAGVEKAVSALPREFYHGLLDPYVVPEL